MSVFRAVAWALAIEAVIGLAIWVGVAHATPTPTAAQANADRTAAWLTRVLHRPVPTRTITISTATEMAAACGAGCAAYVPTSNPGIIVTTTDIAEMWVAPHSWSGAVWGRILIHELLHRPDLTHENYGDGYVEEGVAEAVTMDVYAAWWHWATDLDPTPIEPLYRARVASIRYASARATGSRSWRTREARLWRRALLAADEPTRMVMLAAAAGGAS